MCCTTNRRLAWNYLCHTIYETLSMMANFLLKNIFKTVNETSLSLFQQGQRCDSLLRAHSLNPGARHRELTSSRGRMEMVFCRGRIGPGPCHTYWGTKWTHVLACFNVPRFSLLSFLVDRLQLLFDMTVISYPWMFPCLESRPICRCLLASSQHRTCQVLGMESLHVVI